MNCRPKLILGLAALLGLIALDSGSRAAAQDKEYGEIVRLDPAFDKLVPKDSKIEKLATGFEWSEGPVWVRDGYGDQNYVLFSDIPNNAVMKWKEGAGVSVFVKPAGYSGDKPRAGEPGSNGLHLDPNGKLVLCQHGDRQVARLEKIENGKPVYTSLASKHLDKRFNSPNDGSFDKSGNFYFTDPPYGLEKNVDDPAKEISYQGVYRLSPDGKVKLLTKNMTRPNGIGLSPDEKILYVANSDPEKAIWMSYTIQENGSLGNGKVFADVTNMVGKHKGLPDGLKLDQADNLFATGPGGVHVYSADGKLLGRIDPGNATANCGFGGEDGMTLYITSDMDFCRIRLSTKGKGF